MVSFWGATNALDVSLFVEWGIKDMVSNALIKLFGTIYKSGFECSIGVKIVIGNSRILIGKKTRSQHWQLNSYSFVFGDTIAFVATLHLLKLASFLTSCAIVNAKRKNHCSIAVVSTLLIWTKTILRGYKCSRCKCICGGAFWSRLVDGTKQFDQGIAGHMVDPSTNTLTSSVFVTPQNETIADQLL